MGEIERWLFIGRAFTDDAFLKKLVGAAGDLEAIKKAALKAGITINNSDLDELSVKLGDVKSEDVMASKKLTVFDIIDAISKAKYRSESMPLVG